MGGIGCGVICPIIMTNKQGMNEILAKHNIIHRELEIFLEFVVKEKIPIEKRDNEIIET